MNLTSRRVNLEERSDEVFLPPMRRYKYYPVGCNEENAIQQAVEACAAVAERIAQLGEREKAKSMFRTYAVLRDMHSELKKMGATRTTMGYN